MKKIYGVVSEENCQNLGYFLSKKRAVELILTEIEKELQIENEHKSYYIIEENLYEENE